MLCPAPCKACDNLAPNTCTSCHGGFYLSGTTCAPCFETCQTCSSASIDGCISCKPGFQLYQDRCIKTCTLGSYLNESLYDCVKCHKFCKDCSGPTAFNCTSCHSGFSLTSSLFVVDVPPESVGFCKRDCGRLEVWNGPFPNECTVCHHSCLNCSASTPDSCLTCQPGYYQVLNSCFKCHISCQECTGPSRFDCTSCPSSLVLKTNTSYCEVSCTAAGFAVNYETNVCQPCHTDCKTCFNTTELSCSTCSLMKPLLLANYSCKSNCSTGLYYNVTDLACVACHSDCLECNGWSDFHCSACKDSKLLQLDNSCQLTCKIGSFKLPNTMTCVSCGAGCATCTDYSDFSCLTCMPDLNLQPDFSCKPGCPDKHSPNPSSVCVLCHVNCKACSETGLFNCTECFSDRFLRADNFCQKVCIEGYFYEETTDACMPCHPECAECVGPTAQECSRCFAGMFVGPDGSCVASCPQGTFVSEAAYCLRCHKSCQTCAGPAISDCLGCANPLVLLHQGLCSDDCGDHYYADEARSCLACHTSCLRCSGPQINNCLACTDWFHNVLNGQNMCIDCLNSPEEYASACEFSVSLGVKEAAGKLVNQHASVTLEVFFASQGKYIQRIDSRILKKTLALSLSQFESNNYKIEFDIRLNSMLIDIYSFSDRLVNSLATVTPQQRVVLSNPKNNKSELIFREHSPSVWLQISRAPDPQMIQTATSIMGKSDAVLSPVGKAGPLLSGFAFLSIGSLSEAIMKFFTVFKLVSRLRLINITFGVFLDMLLTLCNSVFKIGGDRIDLTVLRETSNTRGKLDQYDVSVLSVEVVSLQYAVYWLILGMRVYRHRISTYIQKKSDLTTADNILRLLADKGQVTLLATVGLDIFFYSLRCIAHLKQNQTLSVSATFSFSLSTFTVVAICLDLISMVAENQATSFVALRQKLRKSRMLFNRACQKPVDSPGSPVQLARTAEAQPQPQQQQPLKKPKGNRFNDLKKKNRSLALLNAHRKKIQSTARTVEE